MCHAENLRMSKEHSLIAGTLTETLRKWVVTYADNSKTNRGRFV
jgi:hypothetical protein